MEEKCAEKREVQRQWRWLTWHPRNKAQFIRSLNSNFFFFEHALELGSQLPMLTHLAATREHLS